MMSLVKTLFLVLILSLPSISWAAGDVDLRLTRLENIVANELNIGLLNQLENLQQEIRELRGKLEEQQNTIQNLNQKQEKLFLNLDARLNSLAPAVSVSAAAITKKEEPAANIADTSEKSLYDIAQNLVTNKHYPEAIIAFKDLVWQYPEGEHAVDAYYWLGEIYMLQWQENKADNNLLQQTREAFTHITNKYKGQEKYGDALLKLGLLELEQENFSTAKEILQRIVSEYPNTAIARIAENNLIVMQRKP